MGIQGEGEQPFAMLLDRIDKNDDLSNILTCILPTEASQTFPILSGK
jgi:hypothetical protein